MTIQTHTIDIGIDLGTTNSALAAMVSGKPVLVQNAQSRTTTPSVVRVRPNGALDVGQPAYEYLDALPKDVYGEFKRAMGETDTVFTFQASGRQMTPAELSAEVLKVLKSAVQQRLGVLPTAAVITVPAAFDLAQCAATQSAAKLAGFEQAPLIQEPVAASLAYGYSNDVSSGAWLVYDFGGGTFDLALVAATDGRLTVIDHEGDNFLGGKDLDWLIVERILVPGLGRQFAVESFVRGNSGRLAALAVLKRQAEQLKIALSMSLDTVVTVEAPGRESLLDDRGEEIYQDIAVSRAELEEAIAAPVAKTVELSRRLLARNPKVSPSAILLVGGPTLTPFVRTHVASELGLPVDTSADPMTVVAEGAALYAATQPLSATSRSSMTAAAPGNAVAVTFRHTTVTEDTETPIGIQLTDSSAHSIEVERSDGSWKSGLLALTDGAAVVRVPLFSRGQNEFDVRVAATDGHTLASEPGGFSIYRGVTAEAAPLSKSIGVVIRDPSSGKKLVEPLVAKNTPLPAQIKYGFRTTLALEPGGEVETIAVFFVEGESPLPERNRVVGSITVTDSDVSRVVPAGAPIEVQLSISASRLLTAEVFLPSVDQSFAVEFRVDSERVNQGELTKALLREQERMDASTPHMSTEQSVALGRNVDEVRGAIAAMTSEEPGSGQLALSRLQQLQQELDHLDHDVELPMASRAAQETVASATRTTSGFGSESQQRRIEALNRELEAAMAAGDLANIERATAKIRRLEFEVLAGQSWFWKEWFEYLSRSNQDWSDVNEANGLIRAGTQALASGDINALRRATFALNALTAGDSGSFVNVGIQRK